MALWPMNWLLAPVNIGRYLHIIKDVLEKMGPLSNNKTLMNRTYAIDKLRHAHRDIPGVLFGRIVVTLTK